MDCPLSNDGLDERGVPDAATLGAKVLKDNLGLALVELDIENVQKLVELVSVYGAVSKPYCTERESSGARV